MVEIVQATSREDWAEVARLIRAYIDWLPFEVTFQDIDEELADLPGRYGPPRGAALLAKHDEHAIGVVALKDLGDGACEMKRLFVEEAGRGLGAGRLLADAIVAEARRIGYRVMRLDTKPDVMPRANAMYRAMGFVEIPAYVYNPLEGVQFMELRL